MEAEDFGLASSLLQEVLVTAPDDFDVRMLRTKALVRLGDRVQALEEFERLAGHLPNPCKRRADREAVSWCRDTITHLAPERSDLLRAFRDRLETGRPRRQRVMILSGLLLAVAGTGVAFWPKPASSLLARAKEASERGDSSTALALVREIEEKYADSPQYAEASSLRARIEASSQSAARRVDPAAVERILAAADRTAAGLSKWPDPAALADAEALIDLLRTPDAASDKVRKDVSTRLRLPFADAVASLRREATERRDALDSAPMAAAKPPADLETFRGVVERATSALDPAWSASAKRAAAIARRLGSLLLETNLTAGLSGDLLGVDSDVESLARAVAARPRDVERARRELHRAMVVDAYDRARIDAIKILVRGDLDGAEACYAKLVKLLADVETDPVLRPLKEALEKRGIVDFARNRSEMLRNIREGLKAAHESEASGNLAGAATAYAQLAAQFPQVRFDTVFTIPVRVTTTPPTARVALNGQPFPSDADGSTVLRYGWGAPVTVTVTAPGFDTTAIVLKTSDPHPEGEVHVRLAPARRWTRPLVGVVEATPLGIDGDVILCNRSGRVERRARDTGSVAWTTDLKSIEGVRGRPTYDRGVLWIALVDGRVARLYADLGTALPELSLRSRPVGDAASLPGRVAFALDDVVAVFTDGQTAPTYVPIRATVTAGVMAAHGAFWVGDASGGVTRIDASTLVAKAIPSGGGDPIVGLCGGEEAVYALGGDGTLYAVESRAAQTILWKRSGLGDVAGAPAEAEGVVGVADRSGRVRLLEAKDGTSRGEQVLGSPARGGLLGRQGPPRGGARQRPRVGLRTPQRRRARRRALRGDDAAPPRRPRRRRRRRPRRRPRPRHLPPPQVIGERGHVCAGARRCPGVVNGVEPCRLRWRGAGVRGRGCRAARQPRLFGRRDRPKRSSSAWLQRHAFLTPASAAPLHRTRSAGDETGRDVLPDPLRGGLGGEPLAPAIGEDPQRRSGAERRERVAVRRSIPAGREQLLADDAFGERGGDAEEATDRGAEVARVARGTRARRPCGGRAPRRRARRCVCSLEPSPRP